MIISKTLVVKGPNGSRTIFFGEVSTEAEKQDVFALRYKVYSERGYIDPAKYPDGLEIDEYDTQGKSKYFIAKLDEKLIGCIRLIVDDPLPTEIDFQFDEPEQLKPIPRNKRSELGRFIIIPPNKEKGDYLPRGMVMLFLLNVVSSYGMKNGLLGGYSFIKTSLAIKMRKAKLPVGEIEKYIQRYPADGVLYKYFTQAHDPVIPIFFITELFYAHTQKTISNKWIFKTSDDGTVALKGGFLVGLLKLLKIV